MSLTIHCILDETGAPYRGKYVVYDEAMLVVCTSATFEAARAYKTGYNAGVQRGMIDAIAKIDPRTKEVDADYRARFPDSMAGFAND